MRSQGKNKATGLLASVWSGDLDDVERRLDAGEAADAVDADGRTALVHAVIDGSLPLVELLLRHGADVNVQDNNGHSPLHFAARGFRVEIAAALLKAGAHLELQDRFGNTPLSDAVFESRGRGEMIRLLLANGADRERKNHQGVSPLALARSIANYDVRQFIE